MTVAEHTLRADDREGIRLLRQALDRGGYHGPTVDDTLVAARGRPFTRDARERPVYLRALDPEEPLTTLIKLFLLSVPVPREEAARVFDPLPLERVESLGLVALHADRVEPVLEIFPTGELLVVADRYHDDRHPDRADHVLGLSLSARVLACLTVRIPVETALDVGTGSGIHALHAAAHARRVVATDVNPRALLFAEFNALLNGMDHLEFRLGSTFEPVEGETFDLIVSNPPYVISPETAFVYRDSGLPGDTFSEGFVRSMPVYLNEGGYGHLLVEWVHGPDEHWSLPLRRWLEGSGCDALLFHYHSHDPLSHAAEENDVIQGDPDAYAAAVDRWVAYYNELGIERIAWGAIVLRRRSGRRNWISEQKVADVERVAPASEHVLRLIAAQDLLAELGQDGLFDAPLVVSDNAHLHQVVRLGRGGGALESSALRLDHALGSHISVDATTIDVLAKLDGRPLREVLAGIGDERFASGALPVLRRLLELGFVTAAR